MKNPLLDQEFLRKLDLTKNKTTYAKIILLTHEENPVYEVQGKITSGSVSIDGNSAVRRTCSLSMVSPDVDITNTYWALKNKFKLEVGVENTIDNQYPDIVWFKQGTFIFTSLNMNVQSNNFTISINGKDKMCQLNGEVGGNLNASTDFGQLEEYENIYSEVEVDADNYVSNTYYYLNGYGEYILDRAEEATAGRKYYSIEIIRTLISLPIVDIIKNAVQYYAGEPLNNIIINDVDDYGLELLEYRGDLETPMYLLRDKATGEVSNMTFSKEYKGCEPDNKDIEKIYTFGEGFEFYNQSGTVTNLNQNPSSVYVNVNDEKREYNVIKIEFGMTAGYRRTALTYPGELVGAVGESITSAVLDKIKNLFSDFEYFYDIDGKFVFQKKKTYLNTSFSNLVAGESEIYAEDAKYTSAVTYSFENGLLLSAFTDAPQILNIKNDFSIWGVRDSVASANIPVHMRYAIDTKPVSYTPIRFEFQEVALDENTYETNKFYIKNADGKYVLSSAPYRAGMEYYEETERQDLNVNAFQVPTYDWRELIYQMALDYFKYEHKKHNFTQLVAAANPIYYPTGMTGYENYYTDLQGFWRQLYNPEAISITKQQQEIKYVELDIDGVTKGSFSTKNGFSEAVNNSPETLNFWFDFLDTHGELSKYSISAIGCRPKAVNNNKIKAIYFQETPTVLFLTEEDYEELVNNRQDYMDMTGYTFIQLTSVMENYFSISAQGLSAKDELDNLLYQHTYATETVNLTSMPIYHLQPNTRIFVKDDNTGINGEFIVSKITVPLQYNGTTAITTTRAVERIY